MNKKPYLAQFDDKTLLKDLSSEQIAEFDKELEDLNMPTEEYYKKYPEKLEEQKKVDSIRFDFWADCFSQQWEDDQGWTAEQEEYWFYHPEELKEKKLKYWQEHPDIELDEDKFMTIEDWLRTYKGNKCLTIKNGSRNCSKCGKGLGKRSYGNHGSCEGRSLCQVCLEGCYDFDVDREDTGFRSHYYGKCCNCGEEDSNKLCGMRPDGRIIEII